MATFSVVGHSSATKTATTRTAQVAKPSGVQTGDALVAIQFFAAKTTIAGKTIPGWTNFQSIIAQTTRRVSKTTTIVIPTGGWEQTTYKTGKVVVTIGTAYKTVTTYHTVVTSYGGVRVTYTIYTGTVTSWTTLATFVVLLAVSGPVTFSSSNFEGLVGKTAGTTSVTLTVVTKATTDIVVLFALQDAAGITITMPSGTTAGSTSTPLSTKAVYLTPGSIGTHAETTTFSASATKRIYYGLTLAAGVPPSAPTLETPAATAVLDVTTGVTFTASYTNATGSPQNAYVLRIRTSTSATEKYWNASTSSLQSSPVFNATATTPGHTFSVTLPHTVLSNDKQYVWSVASRTAAVNKESTFAPTSTFTTASKPTVSVTAPTGSDVPTAHPLVKFSWTTAPTFTLTSMRVIVLTRQAPTTLPTKTTSHLVWDSGTLA